MGSLPHLVEDMIVLQVFSDGTTFRTRPTDFNVPIVNDNSVVFKDCLYDQTHNLYLRLYKPEKSKQQSLSAEKLPIVVYIHGGGFCVGERDWPNFHNSCLKLASGLNALVVAPDYRLAPEYRLPAAMEDGVRTMQWIQGQALSENGDAWLKGGGVDFDRVFVLGDSSGGNIAHHLAVQLGAGSVGLKPVRVRGYVLMAPFFGGIARTKSEEGPSESFLNLQMLDRFWRLSMPVGESRDHPLANPFGPSSLSLQGFEIDPVIIIVGSNELLRDRSRDYANRLKQMGKKIEYVEFQGKEHGFFNNNPYSEDGDQVIGVIRNFMLHNST